MYEPLKRRDSFVISRCWSHKSYLLFFFLFLLDDDGVVWLDENLFLCIYSTSLTQKEDKQAKRTNLKLERVNYTYAYQNI